MRQVDVVVSNAGQRNPSPWGSGTSITCDPRRSGKACSSTPPARARVISFSAKYGRRTLSGSGNRQQTSHLRQVWLGTRCGRAIGGVTKAPTRSSVYEDIEEFQSMCGSYYHHSAEVPPTCHFSPLCPSQQTPQFMTSCPRPIETRCHVRCGVRRREEG